jgi:hypothetical protein
VKDIQEKKLRNLMTKEFDRLRDVAQVDNFLAGTSQSGGKPAGPVTLSPTGPSSQRVALPAPGGAPAPRVGALPKAGPGPVTAGSASLPRPIGQSR